MKKLKLFLSYYKAHWKLFVGDMICALIVALVDTVFPMMSKYTLDSIIPTFELSLLLKMILIMTLMYIVRAVAFWFINYWGHVFGTKVEADMRRDIFSHIENQDFAFFDNHRTGKIMSRVTNDLFEVTELAHHGPEDLFISILTLLGSFIMLLSIRIELAIIVFCYIPLLLFFTIQSRKNMGKSSRAVKEKTAEINTVLESSISGVRVTKAFANENFEINRFEKGNSDFKKAKKQFYNAMSTFHVKLEFPINLLNVIILAVGGYFIMKGEMSMSDLVAANLFVAAFVQPIKRLTNFVEQYTSGMAGFNRFMEIMETKPVIQEVENAINVEEIKGNISYANVSFSYGNNIEVLSNINLEIEKGKTFAFVGTSGAGKTTLCHLLPRFYEVTSGEILIDNIPIKNMSLKSLRQQIGLVQQDVFLFAGTIKENIAYGKIGATDEDIIEAAKAAEIHEDIMKMPNGYDTLVGERGIKLSGGQKQRVSIARIFLKNPPILILDEATSSLDSVTEEKIQESFDKLSKGRTTLVIAHRLSTIKNADKIVVIGKDGILESGTHSELLAKDGVYAELYNRS